MAHCSTKTSFKVIISNIPKGLPDEVLRDKLEETVGSKCLMSFDYITKTNIRVVLRDRQAFKRIIASSIVVKDGNDEITLDVKEFQENVSALDKEHEFVKCADEVYNYQASLAVDKAILRYICHTDKAKAALKSVLLENRFELLNVSNDGIEVQLPQNDSDDESNILETCDKCIDDFFELYSSWYTSLEDCTKNVASLIKKILSKYKTECFGRWYQDTQTVVVTGPKAKVEEVKNLILNETDDDVAETSSSSGVAQSFCFNGAEIAVLKFVSRQEHYMKELHQLMHRLAFVDISTKDKQNITVKVTPNQDTTDWANVNFKKECSERLKGFFSKFSIWRGKFDVMAVKNLRSTNPDLFTKLSYPDHFIQWFVETGTINVIGIQSQVDRCKHLMQHIFAVKSSTSSGRFPVRSIKPALIPWHPALVRPNLPGYAFASSPFPPMPVAYVPMPVPAQLQKPTVFGSSIRFELQGNVKEQYCADRVPRAILLFVLKDVITKEKFENLCHPFARLAIESETEDEMERIDVHATFLSEHNKMQYGRHVARAIENFFNMYETRPEVYEKEKLEELKEISKDLFSSVPGEFHITTSSENGIVIVTGLRAKVSWKHEQITYEINFSIEEEESTSADIFIAQRECNVWKMTEEKCKDYGLGVSLLSKDPGKIQYRGNQKAIKKAKEILADLTEQLFEKPVQGFSFNQMQFLRKCESSQKKFLETNENILETVYSYFKSKSVQGSIVFSELSVMLVSTDEKQWQKVNEILQEFVCKLTIEDTKGVPIAKIQKKIKTSFKNKPVLVIEEWTKNLCIYCFKTQMHDIRREIDEILQDACDFHEVEEFYPMTEEKAVHILNPHSQCTVYKAKSIKKEKRNGKTGLVVAFERQDRDTVDMMFEDLDLDITNQTETISGHFLYEILRGNESHLKIERDCNCTIFLKPYNEIQSKNFVSVKTGNILDEKCDAIINSTGKAMNFSASNQVSRALIRKYGANSFKTLSKQTSLCLIKGRAQLFTTKTLLPWDYVINISTPHQTDKLTQLLFDLLHHADKLGIKSLALPTIGTGNMGLEPDVVAECMQEAFHVYNSDPTVKCLKDVRIVVYEHGLLPVFEKAVPKQKSHSTGIVATIYGNSLDKLNEARKSLVDLCHASITKAVVPNSCASGFPSYVRAKMTEFCEQRFIFLEWRKTKTEEECLLEGLQEVVLRAREEIEKLLAADFPHSWSPMTDENIGFVKVKVDPSTSEYQAVEHKFKESSPQYTKIKKIERIQIPTQYKEFKTKKGLVEKEIASKSVTRQLFHGTTPDKANKICLAGFDRMYSGENGARYGRGVYFHVNSSYSVGYCVNSGVKCIFLAEVITGEYTQGKSEYISPPVKGNTKKLYNSVVDNIDDPQIFVVFRDTSVYPTYLISFQ